MSLNRVNLIESHNGFQTINVILISGESKLIFDIKNGLLKEGVSLSVVPYSSAIEDNSILFRTDVVLLDNASSHDNALILVSSLRQLTNAGTILLSHNLERDERLRALSHGVDHILHKPVDIDELIAILRNLFRRMPGVSLMRRRNDDNEVWAVDHQRWLLVAPQGKEVPLSNAEYRLLSILMERPGVQHTREELNNRLGFRETNRSRALDVLISKLRKKIEQESEHSFPLRSVRGIGYVFVGRISE